MSVITKSVFIGVLWHLGANPSPVYLPGGTVGYLLGSKSYCLAPFPPLCTPYLLGPLPRAHYRPATSTLVLTAKQWEPGLP